LITGTAQVGQMISVSTGSWANDPTGFSYQWFRGDDEEITDAVSSTYLLTAGEEAIDVYCEVAATNSAGSTSINTADFGPISP
jgi:hypothetical protein